MAYKQHWLAIVGYLVFLPWKSGIIFYSLSTLWFLMTTTDDVEIRKKLWIDEQEQLKSKLITHDTEEWQRNRLVEFWYLFLMVCSIIHFFLINCVFYHRILTRVGGLDISFVKDHPEKAYCTLVIISIPNLNVIYEDSFEVELTAPYIAGKLLEYFIM